MNSILGLMDYTGRSRSTRPGTKGVVTRNKKCMAKGGVRTCDRGKVNKFGSLNKRRSPVA